MSSALKGLAMLFPPIRKIQEDREHLREENAKLVGSKAVVLEEMTRALTVEKSAKQGEKDANGDLAVLREELGSSNQSLAEKAEMLQLALDEKTNEASILKGKVEALEADVKALTSELYVKQISVERHVSAPAKKAAPKPARAKKSSTSRSVKKKPAKRSGSKTSVKA